MLNEFLTQMVPIIERHGGTLDKVMGDGIKALFGAADDMPLEVQAKAAVATGIEMQRSLAALGEKWRREGLSHEIRMRVGVHQDEVTVGNFGAADLMSFTAIGAGVNLTARLESSCTPGRVQVSDAVEAITRDAFAYGPPQEKQRKGFARTHRVFEVEAV